MKKRTFILRSKGENWPDRRAIRIEWVQRVMEVKTVIFMQHRMARVLGGIELNLVLSTKKLLRGCGGWWYFREAEGHQG